MAGRDGGHLLAVVRELHAELGYTVSSGRPAEAWLRGNHPPLWEECENEDDSLVVQLREELAKLAYAAQGEGSERRERAVLAALDGAELVMRAEIAAGREEMLDTHLPGFAFMVALPGMGRKRATKVSERAAELIGDELG